MYGAVIFCTYNIMAIIWSCNIDIHMFLYGLLGTTYIFFYYLCVVHNNLIVKYQLCLNKRFSVSVSV